MLLSQWLQLVLSVDVTLLLKQLRQHPAANSVELVQCHGVNACKGHNDCATADNKCAGHASCKGAGWVATPEKACGDIGGKVGA